MLAGLVLFLSYIEQRSRLGLAMSFVCGLLGMLTKGVAFSFPLLANLVGGHKARTHWRSVAGHFVLVGAVFAYRYRLMGYRDPATGKPAILLWTADTGCETFYGYHR